MWYISCILLSKDSAVRRELQTQSTQTVIAHRTRTLLGTTNPLHGNPSHLRPNHPLMPTVTNCTWQTYSQTNPRTVPTSAPHQPQNSSSQCPTPTPEQFQPVPQTTVYSCAVQTSPNRTPVSQHTSLLPQYCNYNLILHFIVKKINNYKTQQLGIPQPVFPTPPPTAKNNPGHRVIRSTYSKCLRSHFHRYL